MAIAAATAGEAASPPTPGAAAPTGCTVPAHGSVSATTPADLVEAGAGVTVLPAGSAAAGRVCTVPVDLVRTDVRVCSQVRAGTGRRPATVAVVHHRRYADGLRPYP